MQDNLVGYHDIVEAALLTETLCGVGRLAACVQAMIVVSIYHVLSVLLDVLQATLVESFFHFDVDLLLIIKQFSKLPGIGRKTAERLSLYILKTNNDEVFSFSDSLNFKS